MEKRLWKKLDFDKIIEKLCSLCQTNLGIEKIENTDISTDYEIVKFRQRETNEAVEYITECKEPSLRGVVSISDTARRAGLGGVLSNVELLKIGNNLEASVRVKKFIGNSNLSRDSTGIIESIVENIYVNNELMNNIFSAIINEEEVSDNASKDLKTIRRNIISKNESIKSKMNSIITSLQYQKYLQDSIVTIRNDRYVVPVKHEYKNQIKGIVHDQSSSGATLFIEPLSVVKINNELTNLKIEEKKEIIKILKELSSQVGEISGLIAVNDEIFSYFDYVFAKGKLALEMNAVMPMINCEDTVNIKKGRHPLLDKNKVVPIDISIGKETNTLIITGPNTGGKTVTLKTAGLFALMNQWGLHLPALSGTNVCIYKNIFADIGDEQSIEQSLSTFSSHMKNIVNILENVTEKSLVLLDEIGAGTDPVEGAALAIAILNKLYNMKATTIATTHYSELKIYALNNPRVINGSVEFDIETLSPTYRLITGTPGKSNAFEISKKLGLFDDVIKDAKMNISINNIEFEDAIATIEKEKKKVEETKKEINRLQTEQIRLSNIIKNEKILIEDEKSKIISNAKSEAKAILNNAKQESREIINELRKFEHVFEKNERREINRLRQELNDKITDINQNSNYNDDKDVSIDKELKKGDNVLVRSIMKEGIIVSDVKEGEDISVQIGAVKIKTPLETLKKIDSKKENKKAASESSSVILRDYQVSTKVDLRGLDKIQAIYEMDMFIDKTSLVGLKEIEIIHGKGTGALREAIQESLKNNKQIKSFRTGNFGEGGAGVTIVELK